MNSTKIMLVVAAVLLAASLALPQVADAGGQDVPIDYGSLFTGKDAPPGAKAKMKQAAQLAAKGPHCTSVVRGFWIPPKEQMPQYKGKPYMITCTSNNSRPYNVYFSDADLKSSKVKGAPTPVSRKVAVAKCASALRQKYPTARLNGLRTAYDASKASGNAVQEIGLTVENRVGVRVDRVGKCIITPDGKLSSKDVWLIKG